MEDRFTSLAVDRQTAELVEIFVELGSPDRLTMIGILLAVKDGVEMPSSAHSCEEIATWVRESGYAARAETRLAAVAS